MHVFLCSCYLRVVCLDQNKKERETIVWYSVGQHTWEKPENSRTEKVLSKLSYANAGRKRFSWHVLASCIKTWLIIAVIHTTLETVKSKPEKKKRNKFRPQTCHLKRCFLNCKTSSATGMQQCKIKLRVMLKIASRIGNRITSQVELVIVLQCK